ncbi:MAG: esterase [Oxalobacteraceae bacterium]|nr:esterase [Oxalobacteraceae bacterium]
MRQSTFVLALLTSAVLAGCGGDGGGGDQAPRVKFSAQVSFGDSLSDVGTYAVGGVKALSGGKYTVNDIGADGNNAAKNWTELMAAQFGLPAPCAAETGLLSNGFLADFAAAISFSPGCTSYAQGGARVMEPVGPANIAYVDAHNSSQLGQLTVPVVTQISNHLAKGGGKFKGDEIVLVLAGGNDLLYQTNQLTLDATAAATVAGANQYATTLIGTLAAGSTVPATALPVIQLAFGTELANPAHTTTTLTVAAYTAAIGQGFPVADVPAAVASAQAAAATAGAAAGAAYASDPVNLATYVAAMATAGDQLAALVTGQIIPNGANYVTVLNLPDASKTPDALAQSAAVQAWLSAMATTFNGHLAAGLAGQSKVLLVDAYTFDRDQAINPAPYGFSNVTTPACADVDANNPSSPAKNVLHSSLVCNKNTLIAGADPHYKFADSVHPTPFTNLLLARYVSKEMLTRGWL